MVPAPLETVLHMPDVELCVQPPMVPLSERFYFPALPAELPAEFRVPKVPGEVWKTPEKYANLCLWWDVSLDEHRRCEEYTAKNMQYEFRYRRLPGREKGYVILLDDYNPDFWFGGIWDYRDYNVGAGPIKPLTVSTSPLLRTEWNLGRMWEFAVDSGYTDFQFLAELNHRGLDDRSYPVRGVKAFPNYKGFYEKENWRFTQAKLQSKLAKYELPRLLSYGCAKPPFSEFTVNAHNVFVKDGDQPTDPPKRRCTTDFGSSRALDAEGKPGFVPNRAKDPGPLSVNAATDREDRVAFPPLDFLRLKKYANQVDRLRAIRAVFPGEKLPDALMLCQAKDDASAYYEQGPVDERCDPHNVTLVSPGTAYVDPRGCFGHEAWPDLFNRVTFFVNFAVRFRAARMQQSMTVPVGLHRWLDRWGQCRSAAGGTGYWFVTGAYFDDFADASFQFFFEHLQNIKLEVFREFNFSMSVEKEERNKPGDPMALLGIMLHVLEGVLAHDLSKARKYRAFADKLVAEARKSGYVPNAMMDRLEGQFRFSTEADPGLVGDLLVIRAALGTLNQRRNGRTRITAQACKIIERMSARLSLGMATAFQPRRGLLGSTGLPILQGWGDASGDLREPKGANGKMLPLAVQMTTEEWFFGYGYMFWLEGTDTVFVTQQFITYNARKSLNDSTALECFQTNEGLCISCRVRDVGEVDMLQIVDNQADAGISNFGKPKQTAERILFDQRVQLRDTMPPTVVVVHQVDRDRNPETDLLSKHLLLPFMLEDGSIRDMTPAGRVAAGHLAVLQQMVDAKFGCHMQIRPVQPEPWAEARARMAVVVHAKGSETKDGLCSLGNSNAATCPWPRRTKSSRLIYGNTTVDHLQGTGQSAAKGGE